MQFTALKIPLGTAEVILAAASARLDEIRKQHSLPEAWEGVPLTSNSGNSAPIRYQKEGAAGFHSLQIYENTEYFLQVPEGTNLKTSFKGFKAVPGSTSQYYFSIDNYLGTASVQVNEHPPLYFDVISRKLDYQNEYRAIVEAIASQCNQLLLEWSAPTALRFEPDPEKQKQILLEQFLFLRHVLSSDKLDLYLETIRRNPHNSLEFEDEWKPTGAGIPAPGYFEEPMRFGRDWSYAAGKAAQPAQIMSRRKFETLDTPANRFIKFALERFQDICERVIRSFGEDCGTAWMEAHDMRDTLDAFLSAPFFRDVGRLSYMPANNQTLLKREGYRDILHAWLMLDAAAQLDWPGRGDAYDGTTRDVPTLYEYWLYFVMREIIEGMENANKIEIVTGDAKSTKPFIERSRDGLRLNLKQGHASLSAFTWTCPETEVRLRVHFYFNRTFVPHSAKDGDPSEVLRAGSYSRPFRPDYSLVIFPERYAVGKNAVRSLLQAERQAEGDGAIAFLHFDAKYRVDTLEEVFGKATEMRHEDDVEEELDPDVMQELENEHRESAARNTYKRGDLLKMHTYNEAIRRTAGSYVLYPGKSGEPAEFRRFHEILPGVGAFIARPIPDGEDDKIAMQGDRDLRRFIEDVLRIQQDKFSQLYRVNYWTHDTVKEPPQYYLSAHPAQTQRPPRDTDVLLGAIRNERLAAICKQAQCFYCHAIEKDGSPAKCINLDDLQADLFVPYVPDRQSLDWTAEVRFVRLVERRTLIKILNISDTDLKSGCQHYFVVDLKVSDTPPPVKDLSYLLPPRPRHPQLVKWSALCRRHSKNADGK